MGCQSSKTLQTSVDAASSGGIANFSNCESGHVQPFSSRVDLLTRAEKHQQPQDAGPTSITDMHGGGTDKQDETDDEGGTDDERMRHWLACIIGAGSDSDSDGSPEDDADHHDAPNSSKMQQDGVTRPPLPAAANGRNDEGIQTFILGFASFLRQQNINSVIPQPFVDQLAKEVKKPSRAAPGMLRQKDCRGCGSVFYLDGWQADSDFCRHCAPSQRSTVSDANMPKAFIHRINGRYTSIVSEAIGRENGRV